MNPLAALTASVPFTTENPLDPVALATPQPLAAATSVPAGAGGPLPASPSPGPPTVAAAVPEIPGRVAWGLGAGVVVFITTVGTGLALIRRRTLP